MADKYRIVCFLEDTAQEKLIPELLRRLIDESGLTPERFEISLRYTRGGASLRAFKQFIADSKKDPQLKADLLVVGSDANCKGFATRRDWIMKQTAKADYQDVITAIPDPHIERWYLLDLVALSKAAETPLQGSPPAYKCAKDHYKKLLRDDFKGSGIEPPFGGVEYGQLLARQMDLYAADKQDRGLADFLNTFQSWLKRIQQGK